MATPRMRPTFARPLPCGPAKFYRALDEALRAADAPCRGSLFGAAADVSRDGEPAPSADTGGGGAILRRHEPDQHVWSPALHMHVDGDDGGPRFVQGRFSPSSPVWTAFLAIYLVLACIAIACGCYGGAQMILHEDPLAFVGVPIALALMAFTYGAAFIGQGLGSEDMYELRAFVDEVVTRCVAAAPPGQD